MISHKVASAVPKPAKCIDTMRPREAQRLPEQAKDDFAALLNCVGTSYMWPHQLLMELNCCCRPTSQMGDLSFFVVGLICAAVISCDGRRSTGTR
eukprot:3395106-Pyramimonas_sp.AAC.2